MVQYELNNQDKEVVKHVEGFLTPLLASLKTVDKFTVGSTWLHKYLLWSGNLELEVDRFKLPVKYQVVHISATGIPFLKRLNSNGEPVGEMVAPPGINALQQVAEFGQTWALRPLAQAEECFIPDPDQLDAILLDEKYDPCARQRELHALATEITKHNKKLLVPTSCWNVKQKALKDFVAGLQVGDRYWSSPTRFFLVHSKKHNSLTVLDSKTNKEKVITWEDLQNRRIYRDQPRSLTAEAKL